MAKNKMEAIQDWQTPQWFRDIQLFVGSANFYRQFIFGFSNICCSLTEWTKRDNKDWRWKPEIVKAFINVIECFTTVPILIHFNPKHECIVETDASDFELGAVLSQKEDDDRLHPIAFHSRKFSSSEINDEIFDTQFWHRRFLQDMEKISRRSTPNSSGLCRLPKSRIVYYD
jgi:hypothetical protein